MIHESWKPIFDNFKFDIDTLYSNNIVYPPKELIFRVFEIDMNKIKVVILGQDPYHGINQANGLSFSVSENIKIPPSLKNIFKELKLEYPERNYEFNHGNLERWLYEEKIFLLNCSLTVIDSKPASHIKFWEHFTDKIIKYISENNNNCIFLLLGNFAKKKSKFIVNQDNIIYGIHPSPLARGFIGSNIFIKVENKVGIINWSN